MLRLVAPRRSATGIATCTSPAKLRSCRPAGSHLRTLYEGCIGETLAAIEATAASRLALDPVVARVLTRIADDERRHAALAWRFLAWTLEHGDHQLYDALASAVAGVEIAAPQEHEPAVALEGHGRLSPVTKWR